MPPTDGTSVASRLSKVLATLDANPPASYLVAPTTDWLKALAPAVHFTLVRWLLENADNPLVNPALAQVLAQGRREIAAMVRSTVGVVGLKAGGIAANVLPQSGTITLNFRTLPGEHAVVFSAVATVVWRCCRCLHPPVWHVDSRSRPALQGTTPPRFGSICQ